MKTPRLPHARFGALALSAALAASVGLPGPAAAGEETFTTYSSKEELTAAYLDTLSVSRDLPLCTDVEEDEEELTGETDVPSGDDPGADALEDPALVSEADLAPQVSASPEQDAQAPSDSDPVVTDADGAELSVRSISADLPPAQDAGAQETSDAPQTQEPASGDTVTPEPTTEPTTEPTVDPTGEDAPADSGAQTPASDDMSHDGEQTPESGLDDPAPGADDNTLDGELSDEQVTDDAEALTDDEAVECISEDDLNLNFSTQFLEVSYNEDGSTNETRLGASAGRDFADYLASRAPVSANAVDIASQDPDGSVAVVTVEVADDGGIEVNTTEEMPTEQAVDLIREEQRDHKTLAVAVDTPVSVGAEWDDNIGSYRAPTTSRFGNLTSSDTYRADQNMLDPTRPQLLYSRATPQNNVEYVWKYSRGAGVTVAVIDTGVDGNHPDLEGVVLENGIDLVNPNPAALGVPAGWQDGNSHGTHVAGIIAANYDNGTGITGVAPEAKILPVKVMGDDGTGFASDVAQGIIDAVDAGADILNLSLGSFTPNAALEAAVAYANSQGVVVVAAGGNSPDGNYYYNGVNYPASYPNVIGVASSWSGCGGIGGDHIDISARGCNVWSTIPGGGYAAKSGTSMATPMVSGAMALMLAAGVDPVTAEQNLIRYTGRHSSVLAKECTLNEEKSSPGNAYYDCVITGIDEAATAQKYGSGVMMSAQAFGYATGINDAWTEGNYWTASSSEPAPSTPSTPSTPPAASTPSTPSAPSAPSGGGGSSSAPSSGSSSAGGGGGGGLNEISTIVPGTSGAPGKRIALAGWGLETTRAVYFGDTQADFTVVGGGQVDVTVPNLPAGTYVIHAVLAPEVGRASYWDGFTITDGPARDVTTQPNAAGQDTASNGGANTTVASGATYKNITFTNRGALMFALPETEAITKVTFFTYNPDAKKKWKKVKTIKKAKRLEPGSNLAWRPKKAGEYRAVIFTNEGRKRTDLIDVDTQDITTAAQVRKASK